MEIRKPKTAHSMGKSKSEKIVFSLTSPLRTFFYHTGRYALLLWRSVQKPEKSLPYFKQIIREIDKFGMASILLVLIISAFMGSVITLQTAYNLTLAVMPKYVIGLGTRDSMLLEFSSTVIALILAGKVGSNIASEIGTMRITEQIDALEIMGVNSAGYLILPKLIASVFFFPILTLMSMFMGILGGYLTSFFISQVTTAQYVYGLHHAFEPFFIIYSLIKMVVFAFIISTVSAYQGYFVEGGAVEVGKASTKAVVNSDVLILLFNVILTKLLLE